MRLPLVLLAPCLLSLPVVGQLAVQGFDDSRSRLGPVTADSFSFVTGTPFGPARSLVEGAFGPVTYSAVPVVTVAALDGVDVFVITPITDTLSAAEVRALETFVNNGGAVLEARNLDLRTTILGTEAGDPRNESYPVIVDSASPLIAGPYGTVTGLLTGANYAYSVLGDASPVATNSAGPNMIQLDEAPTSGRAGRAVLLGDEEVFISGSVSGERSGLFDVSAGNRVFLLNVFAFLAGAPGYNPDVDGDGLRDGYETNTGVYLGPTATGTDPRDPDTDDDGINDGDEVASMLSFGCPDPNDADSDDDTLLDGAEIAAGTSPCSKDTDGDGVDDNLDPLPTTPGVTSGFLENAARDLAATIGGLDVLGFVAPNPIAGLGRRNSLTNRARDAANDIAAGDYASAIDKLQSILDRMDDIKSPPDWLPPSPERDALVSGIVLLIGLLSI